MSKPRVAVVGGGITGLAAAYELRETATVTLFEATDHLGGKVYTDELDGIPIELGPDSLLARDDEPLRLLEALGLGGDIVEPSGFGAWIATRKGLKRLPDGFFLGVPVTPRAIVRSGLLSPRGAARAALDLIRPRTQIDDDVALGALVRTRFGYEVVERIVAPLMSGIRAGDVDDMSAEMAAPEIVGAARSGRSITLGLRRKAAAGSRPRFIGLRRGMSSLTEALRDLCNAELRQATPVRSITTDEGITIDGEPFDGAVISVPPPVAAAVLEGPEIPGVTFQSVRVMNLVYPPRAVPPLPSGSGILFGPEEERRLIACTWVTQKWPHLAPTDGRTLLRCVAHPDAKEPDVVARVGEIAGATEAPVAQSFHLWEQGSPVFRVGHRSRMQRMMDTYMQRPVRFAGAGYLATGLNDCLAHGRSAAREVVATIRP